MRHTVFYGLLMTWQKEYQWKIVLQADCSELMLWASDWHQLSDASGTYCKYQGVRPQPPGATVLVLETPLGVTVRKLTFAHCMVSHESSTRPPVSPELSFQHL